MEAWLEIKRLSEIKVLLRRAGHSQGRQKSLGRGIRRKVRYMRILADQDRVVRKGQREEKPMGE